MNAPKFIIKRLYIERNDLREIKTHQKRLASIQSEDVHKRFQTLDDPTNIKIQANKSMMSEYLAKEKNDEIERENNQILKRLVEIAKGPKIEPIVQISTTTLGGNTIPSSTKSLNFMGRKKELDRINLENEKIAKRLMKVNPVISSKMHNIEYEKNKELAENIKRFHNLKEKEDAEYDFNKRKREIEEMEEKDKMLDPEYRKRVEELNNQHVHLLMELQKIKFYQKKFEPLHEDDQYFLEIKACYKGLRKTNPEKYEDFSKSVINEFFNMSELRKTKMIYLGFYKMDGERVLFIGDFEMDLAHHMASEKPSIVSFELENLKNPPKNYLPKDSDFRGVVTFSVKLKLNVVKSVKLQELPEPLILPPISKISTKQKIFGKLPGFNRESSKLLQDSMKLSRKYTTNSQNPPSEDPSTNQKEKVLNFELVSLKLSSESQPPENAHFFCSIEFGIRKTESLKVSPVNGVITFNEKLSVIIGTEKEIKISCWYTENDNSFVAIGNGVVELNHLIAEINGKKDEVEKEMRIGKDGGNEGGVVVYKVLLEPK